MPWISVWFLMVQNIQGLVNLTGIFVHSAYSQLPALVYTSKYIHFGILWIWRKNENVVYCQITGYLFEVKRFGLQMGKRSVVQYSLLKLCFKCRYSSQSPQFFLIWGLNGKDSSRGNVWSIILHIKHFGNVEQI